MDFFSDAKDSPARIVSEFATRDDPWWGPLATYEPDPHDPKCFSDLVVLRHDVARVWCLESWECLFDKGAPKEGKAYCKDYGEVVGHLARLSSHRFCLAGEAARRGTLTVLFAGKKFPIKFRTDSNVFSMDFLEKINEVIAPSQHEFVFISNQYCTGFILLLSTEEKERLRIERGWQYFSFK